MTHEKRLCEDCLLQCYLMIEVARVRVDSAREKVKQLLVSERPDLLT